MVAEADDVARYLRYFGANVRKYRLARGLNQGQLAELVDLEPLTIRVLERARRRPSFETIVRLAGVLEVDVAALFVEAELPDNPVGRPPRKKPRRR